MNCFNFRIDLTHKSNKTDSVIRVHWCVLFWILAQSGRLLLDYLWRTWLLHSTIKVILSISVLLVVVHSFDLLAKQCLLFTCKLSTVSKFN
jgi:hypothetical protein